MVRFTDHAKDHMRKRRVTDSDVATVLSNPSETVVTRANRLASYASIHGNYIVVIHEKQNGEDVVVTAMSVDRRRLARYGFTQV